MASLGHAVNCQQKRRRQQRGQLLRRATSGWARQITSLHISYSWVTMAVPVGSFFMLISTIRNIIERIKTPAGQEVKHEAGRDVG